MKRIKTFIFVLLALSGAFLYAAQDQVPEPGDAWWNPFDEMGNAGDYGTYIEAPMVSYKIAHFYYIDTIRSDNNAYLSAGIFYDPYNGYRHFMIVNRSIGIYTPTFHIKLRLPIGTYQVWDMTTDPPTQISPISQPSSSNYSTLYYTDLLASGQGALYRIKWVSATPTVTLPSEDVHATQYNTGRKLIADQFGGLHLCYGNKDVPFLGSAFTLNYAYSNDGQKWSTMLLDDEDGGLYTLGLDNTIYATTPAIALDKSGHPFVIYKKPRQLGSGATIRMVDVDGWYKQDLTRTSSDMTEGAPSIAIDSATDDACITFPVGNEIRFSHFNLYKERPWPLSSFVLAGLKEPSVVSLGQNAFVIVARENKTKASDLYYSLLNGSSYVMHKFGSEEGKYPSIGYSNGVIYIVYITGSNDQYIRLLSAPVISKDGKITGIGSFTQYNIASTVNSKAAGHPEIVDGLTIVWHEGDENNEVIRASYRTSAGGVVRPICQDRFEVK
ncbi:hypothetical protein GX441_06595 [bacterium]|nr:hypothetical protein [bacterium]